MRATGRAALRRPNLRASTTRTPTARAHAKTIPAKANVSQAARRLARVIEMAATVKVTEAMISGPLVDAEAARRSALGDTAVTSPVSTARDGSNNSQADNDSRARHN